MRERTIFEDPRTVPGGPPPRPRTGKGGPGAGERRHSAAPHLPRPLRTGARGRRDLPLRSVAGAGRAPLRQEPPIDASRREHLDPRGACEGVHGEGSGGEAVRAPLPHSEGGICAPRPCRRTRLRPRAEVHLGAPSPARPTHPRRGDLSGLPARAQAPRRRRSPDPAGPPRQRAQGGRVRPE